MDRFSILYPFFKAKRTKVILYMSIVRSMLLYGCEAWSILANCHRKRVQIFQNKCLEIILKPPRYTRITELHDLDNLTYIEILVEKRIQNMFLKISELGNPLVRAMGKLRHRRATHWGIFRGVVPVDTKEPDHHSDDRYATSSVAQLAGLRHAIGESFSQWHGPRPVSNPPRWYSRSLCHFRVIRAFNILQCLYKAGYQLLTPYGSPQEN